MACLAQIIYPAPTPQGWEQWIADHQAHHDAIEAGISERFGVPPIHYQLYPFFEKDMSNWLLAHVAAHDRMRQYLGFSGDDLSNLDRTNKTQADAWLWSNYVDHLAGAERLGTTIT